MNKWKAYGKWRHPNGPNGPSNNLFKETINKYITPLSTVVTWMFYGMIISAMGTPEWYPKEYEDGWYVTFQECEPDTRGGNDCWEWKDDGPFTENQIMKYYNKELNKGKERVRKYGTVYNLTWDGKHSDKFLISLFCGILEKIITFGPLVLLLYIDDKKNKQKLKNE